MVSKQLFDYFCLLFVHNVEICVLYLIISLHEKWRVFYMQEKEGQGIALLCFALNGWMDGWMDGWMEDGWMNRMVVLIIS